MIFFLHDIKNIAQGSEKSNVQFFYIFKKFLVHAGHMLNNR